MDISGLFQSSEPVVQVIYQTETESRSTEMVDVKIIINDEDGISRANVNGKSIEANNEKVIQYNLTIRNHDKVVVYAEDNRRNIVTKNVTINSVNNKLRDSKKLALIIGNSNYQYSAPLKNPKNDALAMSYTMEELGFRVITLVDGTQEEMLDALKAYASQISRKQIALFFYAGHGMQVGGKNYLIPTDAQFKNGEVDVEFESINVEMITKIMDQYISGIDRLNLLILDACRNNPFRSWSRGGEAGLASMSAPSGTLVAFSTSPGSIASDGERENGLYTGELIKQLKVRQRIEDVFINTRNAVEEISSGQQSPWELARLKGQYYLIN